MFLFNIFNWVQRKVSELADRYDNLRVPITASERVAGETPYYGANGIQDYVEGFTHNGEFVLVAEDGANDLQNYPVQYVDGKVWVNNHAHVLQAKEERVDNKFLTNALKHTNIEPYLVGGGRAKLNADVMMKINFKVPTLPEQVQIGKFFDNLDHLITLHQRELELFKSLKTGLLQKMFPSTGESIPELRFANFDYEWVQHKLGGVVKKVKSYSLSRDVETEQNTGFEYIHYGDIHTKKADIIDADTKLPSIVPNDYDLIQDGDVIVADASEDYLGIAEPAVVVNKPTENLIAGLHTISLRPKDIHPLFLYYLLHTEAFKHFGYQMGTGLKVFGISYPNLAKFTFSMPTLKEQEQIANMLHEMDNLITANQRQLDLLKEQKKGLLQKMFL